jgi:hypothetical protein
MSGELVARSISSILKAVKEGKKLEVVARTKTWTAEGVKGSKTWGVLVLDGKETPIELNDVRVFKGLKTHTFENKLAVSMSINWTDEQVAELKELEELIIKDGLFVTFKDKLKAFDSIAEFKKHGWIGSMLPEKQVVDANGLTQEGKFYPRGSFIDCPFAKEKGVNRPDFEIKNADGTDVPSWQKLEGAKLNAKRIYLSYEIMAPSPAQAKYKVKLICRQIVLNEGGHVTIVSESDPTPSPPVASEASSNKRKADSVASPETDKKLKTEPTTTPQTKSEPPKPNAK